MTKAIFNRIVKNQTTVVVKNGLDNELNRALDIKQTSSFAYKEKKVAAIISGEWAKIPLLKSIAFANLTSHLCYDLVTGHTKKNLPNRSD